MPGEGVSRPGADKERLVALDFVRGVAVLGILCANIVGYSQPMLASAWPGALAVPMDGGDRLVWAAQFLLVDGKMRGLFAILFGAGMVLFTDAKGAGLQARRLGWLALFGLAHYFLLFRGDILFSYAFCGLAVLALGAHRLGAAAALTTGIALYLLGAVFSAVLYLPELAHEQAALAACPDLAQCLSGAEDGSYWARLAGEHETARGETAAMRGTWGGIAAYNLAGHLWGPLWGALMALFESFPAMLIGIGLYRAGLFGGAAGEDAAPGRLPRWAIWGILSGVALSVPLAVWLVRAGDPLYLTFFVLLGPAQAARLPMLLGLAAWLAWLAPRVAHGWLGRRLVAAGRMAFSNYLGTSLAMAAVFQGWGLGLYGQLGRVEMLGPVLLGWIAMLAWSRPWLAHFRQGPLEWAWRCLTYGQLLPMRRQGG